MCQDLSGRKRLEEQLRQAQKMEAMGLLVGGIAHDFNNLLTIIGGYSRMLMRDIDPQTRAHYEAEQVADAADRAAALTSQLLSFSRKQIAQPAVQDLNAVVGKIDKMLRRILGEDVELTTTLGLDAGSVKVDRGHIEQILMNLAVNSRFAMPEGGRLRIDTSNAVVDREYRHGRFSCPPGRYVLLSVSDTGSGMDERTRERIFEPFFTTRGAGEGTGLGLATVYRIVEQSCGHILVYSEPGSGTTFKIYFPRADEAAPAAALPVLADEPVSVGTVLLVEDETQVLETVKYMLTRQAYTVSSLGLRIGSQDLRVLSWPDRSVVDGCGAALRKRSGAGAGVVRATASHAGHVHVRLCGSCPSPDRATGRPRAAAAEAVHSPDAPGGRARSDATTHGHEQIELAGVAYALVRAVSRLISTDGLAHRDLLMRKTRRV